MTKDVLVSITGAHVIDGEAGGIEVITVGNYYFKNGRHYIIYDEVLDGIEGSIRNTVKVSREAVDVIKSGGTRSHMVFEQKKKNMSCYVTPFGEMMIGVNTNSIEVEEQEDMLLVKVDYTLDVNYEQASHCLMTMNVQSKSKVDFHLKS